MTIGRTHSELQMLLREIGTGIRTFTDRQLTRYGITHQQGMLLGVLHEREDASMATCQRDLESMFGVKGPAITSLLQGLERKGFVVRRNKVTDARVKELFITKKAWDLIREFHKVFNEAEERLLRGFTGEDRRQLLGLLKRICENTK